MGRFYFYFLLDFYCSEGVLIKQNIPLALDGYEMIIAHSSLHASLAICHLISNARSSSNCQLYAIRITDLHWGMLFLTWSTDSSSNQLRTKRSRLILLSGFVCAFVCWAGFLILKILYLRHFCLHGCEKKSTY